jgi:tRNA (adenine9-N1/guanine9-N1)-methyltransferase
MTDLTVADADGVCCKQMERPGWRLKEKLVELGVETLCVLSRTRSRRPEDVVQELALKIALGKSCLYPCSLRARRLGSLGRTVVAVPDPKGELRCNVCAAACGSLHSGSSLTRIVAEAVTSYKTPLIAIDFTLLSSHAHPSEISSLRKQVGSALAVVRAYLWDQHLVLAGAPAGLREWLYPVLGKAFVQVTSEPSDLALKMRGAERVVLLDPSAPEPLAKDDVLGADGFIIGAIVDKIPRPGETSKLRLAGEAERRRIELRGEPIGVPNRINAVIEIIMRARYETCGDVEKAVLRTMSSRDARLRAYVEVARWASRHRTRHVPWSLYKELSSWLPLNPKDFVRAVRMAGLTLERGGERRSEHG